MKLAHFHSWQTTEPHVTQLLVGTREFSVGDNGGTEWIDVPERAVLAYIRRERLPDLIFTAVGYGVLLGDAAVPGNRSGNPVEEEQTDGRRRRRNG